MRAAGMLALVLALACDRGGGSSSTVAPSNDTRVAAKSAQPDAVFLTAEGQGSTEDEA